MLAVVINIMKMMFIMKRTNRLFSQDAAVASSSSYKLFYSQYLSYKKRTIYYALFPSLPLLICCNFSLTLEKTQSRLGPAQPQPPHNGSCRKFEPLSPGAICRCSCINKYIYILCRQINICTMIVCPAGELYSCRRAVTVVCEKKIDCVENLRV